MSFIASLFAPRASSGQSLSDPNHWITRYVAPKTFAGVQVNEQGALGVTAVFRAIALISEAVAMLPVDVFQRVGTRREERPDHPVARVLREPNDRTSSVDLRSAVQGHVLGYGNGFLDVVRDEAGRPSALWPLFPDRTTVDTIALSDGTTDIRYRTNVGGKTFDLHPANVVHVRGLSFDGIRGYSPLHIAREAVGLALGLEQFGAKFFGNEARSGGFLEHPGKLTPEAVKRISDAMERQGGIDNAHRIKILEEGMKYNPATIAPEDAQFLLTRQFQVEEIARLFGVPLHMLQSQSKTTSWGSGIAQMSLGFLIYTVEPYLVRWEQELAAKLFTREERDAGYYVKHNVNALLRADAESRASFYTAALNTATGWMTRDEVRALEDLNPDTGSEPGIPTRGGMR